MDLCDQPILSTVCDTVDAGAATVAAAPIQWISNAVGESAAFVVESLWLVFDQTTLVNVVTPNYVGVYNLMFGIGVTIALLLYCFQLITAVVKREPGALTRAGIGLGKSVLGSFVTIMLVALGLEITDQLCIGIVQAAGESTASMGEKILHLITALTSLSAASPGIGAIVTLFLGGLAIAAGAIVWLSLLVRKSLLLLAVALAPLALAGASWDATKGWASKWLMFVVALIVSKLVLTVILLVAVSQLSTPIALDIQAITDPFAGIVLLAVAGFAPYITYKAISWLGVDYYHAMSTESEAKNALNRPVPVPNRMPGNPSKILDGDGPKPRGSGNGGGNPPPPPGSGTPAAAPAAGSGAGASAGSGAGAGAGAAAGPIGLAIAAAFATAKKAATAGPELGNALGQQAEGHMDSAGASDSGSNSAHPSAPQPPASPRIPPQRALPPSPSGDPEPPTPSKS